MFLKLLKSKVLVVALLADMLFCTSANAHKLNAAETTATYNERTSSFELVHRFYIHDVDHLTQQMFAKNVDKAGLSQTEITQKRLEIFVDYIVSGYLISGIANDAPQDLLISTIGHEVENKFLYIYQEFTPGKLKTSELVFDISAMQNQWLPSYLLINVNANGYSNKTDELQSITLNRSTLNARIAL